MDYGRNGQIRAEMSYNFVASKMWQLRVKRTAAAVTGRILKVKVACLLTDKSSRKEEDEGIKYGRTNFETKSCSRMNPYCRRIYETYQYDNIAFHKSKIR